MSFDDIVDLLRNPGDNPIPSTIYDDLNGYYATASNDLENAHSRIKELENEVSDLKFKIAELEGSDDTDDSDSDSDSDNSTISIDDLFEEGK